MVEKNLQQIQLQKIQEQMREINKPRKMKTWPKNSKLCMEKKKIRIFFRFRKEKGEKKDPDETEYSVEHGEKKGNIYEKETQKQKA
jgi:hypothetical protein